MGSSVAPLKIREQLAPHDSEHVVAFFALEVHAEFSPGAVVDLVRAPAAMRVE